MSPGEPAGVWRLALPTRFENTCRRDASSPITPSGRCGWTAKGVPLRETTITRRLGSRARRSWAASKSASDRRSEEHTSELQSRGQLVCRLLLEKNNKTVYERT